MSAERRYSEQEVRAILERALEHDRAEGLSHSDLIAAATEAGISGEAVERAAQEVEDVRERALARERILARRRGGFFSHLWTFIGVNVFLVALNLIVTPDYFWFLFPLLGWGLGVFLSARYGFSKEIDERRVDREVQRARLSAPRRRAPAIAAAPRRRVDETVAEPGDAPAPDALGPDAAAPDAELERARQRK